MAHKTLISGTAYSVTGGRELIGGTGYAKKKGRVLVNGTGSDIPFSSGIPIGTLPVGSVVKIGVNGKSYDFLVVNQGVPSNSSLYDRSCDGTWMLMEKLYESRLWKRQYGAYYELSDINSYLNEDFLDLLEANVKSVISQVKIPYVGVGGNIGSGASGLSCKVFLLSGYEVGLTNAIYGGIPKDGAKLAYFEDGVGTTATRKRIAMYENNTEGAKWWMRSSNKNSPNEVLEINYAGKWTSDTVSKTSGVRPAFTIPGTFPVIQNPDGTYSPAA